MALPMLAGGADCGPSNPLQGLTKRFDQDRGVQQDQFRASKSGLSREAFHTQRNSAPDADAARFFSAVSFSPEKAYDFAALRGALAHQAQLPQQPNLPAGWASDFAQEMPIHGPSSYSMNVRESGLHHEGSTLNGQVKEPPTVHESHQVRQWAPPFPGNVINPIFGFRPLQTRPSILPTSVIPMTNSTMPFSSQTISWDKEFNAQETELVAHPSAQLQGIQQDETAPQQLSQEADEMARTAGLLLENVKNEQNPKFQNSQFMGLMRQLRDGEVVVEGNQMVENIGQTTSNASDLKGKGRAVPSIRLSHTFSPSFAGESFVSNARELLNNVYVEGPGFLEDPNDAYFQQENTEYARYWKDTYQSHSQDHRLNQDVEHWDKLGDDWERFDVSTTGITPVATYRFQDHNPYLFGDSSGTRNHSLHKRDYQSVLENVLELEAAVQRNTNNASAWYELGVKQQENEREGKAIQALQRAISLDPSHLPTWLALAISHTNDNNRAGTYDDINEWVSRNEKYKAAVQKFRTQNQESSNASTNQRFNHLIQCLIAMARSNVSGEVDADIQIALAVLLNSNEDYEKAQDCFRTALAVRPEDWLLYNRVGATMANSGNASEALQYYYKALELNPGYIRARFNLGISCINLRRYEEAAQHILDALVLQDNDGVQESAKPTEMRGVKSTALWDSLKTTCLHMQRVDLATLCDRQDLEAFRLQFYT